MNFEKMVIILENEEVLYFDKHEIKDISIGSIVEPDPECSTPKTDYFHIQIKEGSNKFYRLMKYNDISDIRFVYENGEEKQIKIDSSPYAYNTSNSYQTSFYGDNKCLNIVISRDKTAGEVFKDVNKINKFDKNKNIRLTDEQIDLIKGIIKFSDMVYLNEHDKSIRINLDMDQYSELEKENLELFFNEM